jgi:hypothetical protein
MMEEEKMAMTPEKAELIKKVRYQSSQEETMLPRECLPYLTVGILKVLAQEPREPLMEWVLEDFWAVAKLNKEGIRLSEYSNLQRLLTRGYTRRDIVARLDQIAKLSGGTMLSAAQNMNLDLGMES